MCICVPFAHPEMWKKIRAQSWNGNQIEAVYVTWKLKNSNVASTIHGEISCRYIALFVFSCSLQDIDRIFGSSMNVAPTRQVKNWSNHNKANKHSAQIFECIAYEILMRWCWQESERDAADHKQMGESQGKSENDFHYSFLFRIEFIVFATSTWNVRMNSLWYFVMISSIYRQHTWVFVFTECCGLVIRTNIPAHFRFHCHSCFHITDNLIRK